MASISDVYDIAVAFLDASIAALQLTAEGPPARAFVSPGDPALDCCPQLTVHTQAIGDIGLFAGNGALAPADRIRRGGAVFVTLVIQITRCVAVSTENGGKLTPPSPSAQQASAQVIDEDGWALWLGISDALKHGDLHEICSGAERLGGVKLQPQGGCGGWVFTYRYPIEGGILAT